MAEVRLAEFELLVLMAALRLGPDDAYAVPMVEEIRSRTGRPTQRGHVYTALQRLEARGLVSTRLGAPRPERGGKARRLVTVTPAGVEAVRAAAGGLRAMWQGLEPILGMPG